MENKKGESLLIQNVVYIIFALVFILGMLFAVTRAGSQAINYEQVHAKQIALIINKAKPGMEIRLGMADAYILARKNKFSGNIVTIDNNENKVNVKLVNGKGYSYYYFSDVDVVWDLDENNGFLSLKIFERRLQNANG